jgi:hypothetical protein
MMGLQRTRPLFLLRFPGYFESGLLWNLGFEI